MGEASGHKPGLRPDSRLQARDPASGFRPGTRLQARQRTKAMLCCFPLFWQVFYFQPWTKSQTCDQTSSQDLGLRPEAIFRSWTRIKAIVLAYGHGHGLRPWPRVEARPVGLLAILRGRPAGIEI